MGINLSDFLNEENIQMSREEVRSALNDYYATVQKNENRMNFQEPCITAVTLKENTRDGEQDIVDTNVFSDISTPSILIKNMPKDEDHGKWFLLAA
ncbi:hypothetical protein [uncultured Enterococcus sp.]|uniref:hypothetical protein n=1 Tax=uncultured Enterococcus sp. TaxID=167972 RepID=UPI002AA6C8AA|nr:hypothetical protein [uncultured Enterococcus sp.]